MCLIRLLLTKIFRGLGTACCIRVGQNLGAGDGEGAKISYRVSAILTGTGVKEDAHCFFYDLSPFRMLSWTKSIVQQIF